MVPPGPVLGPEPVRFEDLVEDPPWIVAPGLVLDEH